MFYMKILCHFKTEILLVEKLFTNIILIPSALNF